MTFLFPTAVQDMKEDKHAPDRNSSLMNYRGNRGQSQTKRRAWLENPLHSHNLTAAFHQLPYTHPPPLSLHASRITNHLTTLPPTRIRAPRPHITDPPRIHLLPIPIRTGHNRRIHTRRIPLPRLPIHRDTRPAHHIENIRLTLLLGRDRRRAGPHLRQPIPHRTAPAGITPDPLVREQVGGIVQAVADGGFGGGAVVEFDGVAVELRGGRVETGEAVSSRGGLAARQGPEGLLSDGGRGRGCDSGTIIADDAVGGHLRGECPGGSGGVGDARDEGRAGSGVGCVHGFFSSPLAVLGGQSGIFRGV